MNNFFLYIMTIYNAPICVHGNKYYLFLTNQTIRLVLIWLLKVRKNVKPTIHHSRTQG